MEKERKRERERERERKREKEKVREKERGKTPRMNGIDISIEDTHEEAITEVYERRKQKKH